jgi:methionine aminopeptidase
MDLSVVRKGLRDENADAWIIFDYENKNPTLVSIWGKRMLTRKLIAVFPRRGKPYLICHEIDRLFLEDESIKSIFSLRVYKTWKEMLALEEKSFKDYKRVLCDISDNGLLPRISLADYGSVAYLKELGLEVGSSGNILQRFSATYDDKAYKLQLLADTLALQIKDKAFAKIKELIEKNGSTSEFEIQSFIVDEFEKAHMVFDDPPIVAVGKNASNPHYGPDENHSSPIKEGDLVLIDMWAKMDDPDAVYADITWMGYVGTEVPAVYAKRFAILKEAIDRCIDFLNKELPKRKVRGYEVDDVARGYIQSQGYGKYFLHRTGHSIAVDVGPHGPGVNIDDYESHDEREIIDGVTFSLEPGIYAPDFGMRSETNVYIKKKKPVVVAGRQDAIIPILSL